MKFPVLLSGLGCHTVKCSEILAHIELLYNPRVNKVFILHFTLLHTSKFRGWHSSLGYCSIEHFFIRCFGNLNRNMRHCDVIWPCGMWFLTNLVPSATRLKMSLTSDSGCTNKFEFWLTNNYKVLHVPFNFLPRWQHPCWRFKVCRIKS